MSTGKRIGKRGGDNLPRGITSPRPGAYRVRVFYGGRLHSLGVYDTLTDARAVLAIAKGDLARGNFTPPPDIRSARRAVLDRARAQGITLASWADDWLKRLEATDRRPGTIRAYRSLLDVHILPALGDMPLRDLEPADIERLIGDLRALPAARYPGARGNGVAGPAARCLRACLNGAVAAGHLERSPFQSKVPAERRVRPDDDGTDVATPAQVAALAAAMPEHLAIAVPLAAWCQLRLGEVLGLQRQDFAHLDDPSRAVLHVRRQLNSKTSPPSLTPPKSDAGRRTVAIPSLMLPALREHIAQHAAPGREGPLLTIPSDPGRYVSQTTFDRYWRAARADVGLPALRFHDLRHVGLTAYARAGATAAELMHRGGHSSLEVALRYQHATLERDRAITDALSVAVEKSSPL